MLDERLGLGDAVGGLLLLGLAGSLPELAITASAALSGERPDSLAVLSTSILGVILLTKVPG